MTVKHRFTCVLMGSKCPASPEDTGYTGWVGKQGDGVVTVVLLAKNCNEMLGLNSLIQGKLWYLMDLVMACNERTRVTNIPCTYLVLLAPESLSKLLLLCTGSGEVCDCCPQSCLQQHLIRHTCLCCGGHLPACWTTDACPQDNAHTTIDDSCLPGSIQTQGVELITPPYKPGTKPLSPIPVIAAHK